MEFAQQVDLALVMLETPSVKVASTASLTVQVVVDLAVGVLDLKFAHATKGEIVLNK